MFSEVFCSSDFWIGLGVPLGVALLIAGKISANYSRLRRDLVTPAEGYRVPINNCITVTGIVLPLAISFVAYSLVSLKQNPKELSVLIASICLLFLSIVVGLWNSFSMSTLTGKDGEFLITSTDKTHFPAQFAFQLMLFLSSLLLMGLFLFTMSAPIHRVPETQAHIIHGGVEILREPIQVGMSSKKMEAAWGKPNDCISRNGITYCRYYSKLSEYKITIVQGRVFEVKERKKSNGDKS